MSLALKLAIISALTSALAAGSQLPIKIYTTADGLASNRINYAVQDSHGYLWFCTPEGISRFDGYSFTNYGAPQGLDAVQDMFELPTGEYWLATVHGLVRFDPEAPGRKFTAFFPADNRYSSAFYAIAPDRAGGLWAGTFTGLYRLEPATAGNSRSPREWRLRRIEIGTPQTHEAGWINALVQDRKGALWIGAESGLYRLSPDGVPERFTTGNGLPANPVKSLVVDRQGRLWAGTDAGLCRIAPDPAAGRRIVERIYGPADGLSSNHIESLSESSAGRLWAGTYGGLSELVSDSLDNPRPFQTYTMANGLTSLEINSITEDRNGNLWIGSAEGVMKITRSDFSTFTPADGLPALSLSSTAVRVSSIFQDRSGAPCVTVGMAPTAQRNPLLSCLEGDRFKSIFPNLPSGDELGWSSRQIALQDHAGDWWLATPKGLARFASPARFEQLAHMPAKALYRARDGLSGPVMHVFEDSRGDIWVATFPRGLVRWDRRTATFRRHEGVPYPGLEQYISAFGEDRAGNVWIGLYHGGVLRFRNGRYDHFGRADGLGAGGIGQIYCDRAGRLWIATWRGGVTRIDSPATDSPRFTNMGTAQGLSFDGTTCITEDRWGRIYVCGPGSVDRLDPTSAGSGWRIKHFTTFDGLIGGNMQAALADRDGNLWFGSTLGLSRLVPQADPSPSAPRVLISGFSIRGVPYPLSDLGVAQLSNVRLRPDQSEIGISFVGLSFAAGELLRYQFMLADLDRDWGPPTTERTVNYASLKPGSYRFLVRAVNSAGAGESVPAAVAFTLPPPVWQRWWFLALCACTGLCALYTFHRARVGRLLQLERIRTRIATDLHDDIGASLSQIAVVSEALSQRAGAGHQFQESLAQIAMDSREMVASMSDLVWSIDPRRDHLHDLVQRMRRFSGDMLAARNIEFRFTAPAGDVLLSLEQRRHIFLICKEGVNNIVRHSACTAAQVGLSFEAEALVLRVEDNGCGLDLSQAGRGNGLNGMRARAKALGGQVEFMASQASGTAVTLKIPLDRLRSPRWKGFFHLYRW